MALNLVTHAGQLQDECFALRLLLAVATRAPRLPLEQPLNEAELAHCEHCERVAQLLLWRVEQLRQQAEIQRKYKAVVNL